MENIRVEELNKNIETIYDMIYKDLNIDYSVLTIELKKLYRNAIKAQKYKIQIGDYYIDMEPKNINICYDSKDTYIEINKDDQQVETHRPLDIKYYVISDTRQDTYPITTPCIKVSGEALSMDGIKTDNRYIELLNPKFEMRLKNYCREGVDLINITTATIITEVDPSEPIIDPIKFLKRELLIPVKLNYFDKNFTRIKETIVQNDYKKYFPRTANKMKIIKLMLNTLIDFYNSFK